MTDDFLKALKAKYPTMFLLSDDPLPVEAISSGSYALDYAIGIGGFPRGRISEIFGPESSGKTTVAYCASASAQKVEPNWISFIDAEHVFDPVYARAIGLDEEHMVLFQPDYGEQALTFAEDCLQSGGFSAVVVDSVAALVPKAELEGDIGDAHIGLQARMMSQALRKIAGVVRQSSSIVLFINQTRQKIGTFYGSGETTPGGLALRYYSSVRVRLSVVSTKTVADSLGRITVKALISKNKCAAPYKTCQFDICFGRGIDRPTDLFEFAKASGFLEARGGNYYRQGETEPVGRGRDAVVELITNDMENWDLAVRGYTASLKQDF